MSQHLMLRKDRKYKRDGGKIIRVRIPMKPPIECAIIDSFGEPVRYNPVTKKLDRWEGIICFVSRSQAKKALWHILQDPDLDQKYTLRNYTI